MLLEGMTAIITGGASQRGIGRATARLFAEHGARVAVADRDTDGARDCAGELPGEAHIGLACEVTDEASCERAFAAALDAFGQVDILINNAGISQPLRTMEISRERWDEVMDINLRGAFHMSRAVAPHMRARRSGSIVNMASVAGQRGGGIFGGPHYAASKAGLLGLTKAMAREFAPDNVRVNAICPSMIDTDIFGGKLTPEQRETIISGVPMGRAGTSADVAGTALFLASPLSSYVTGSEIDVNGGSHIH